MKILEHSWMARAKQVGMVVDEAAAVHTGVKFGEVAVIKTSTSVSDGIPMPFPPVVVLVVAFLI